MDNQTYFAFTPTPVPNPKWNVATGDPNNLVAIQHLPSKNLNIAAGITHEYKN